MLHLWASVKGGAHTCFIDVPDINAFAKCTWTLLTLIRSQVLQCSDVLEIHDGQFPSGIATHSSQAWKWLSILVPQAFFVSIQYNDSTWKWMSGTSVSMWTKHEEQNMGEAWEWGHTCLTSPIPSRLCRVWEWESWNKANELILFVGVRNSWFCTWSS